MATKDLGPWIHTFPSGQEAHVLNLQIGEISIKDIARSLSMQCRYVGHVQRFYSVAEHSVRVCDLVAANGGSVLEQKWALLHDASEAYTGDMSRPLKYSPEMQDVYRRIEKQVMRAICIKFWLPDEEPEIVTKFDNIILGTECAQLKPNLDRSKWAVTTATGNLAPAEPLVSSELGWSWQRAEATFLEYSRQYHIR